MDSRVIATWRTVLPREWNDPHSTALLIGTGGKFAVDRFGFLNKYSPIRTFEYNNTVPNGNTFETDLGILIDRRAEEIVNSTEKNIVVLYSGGVDSTTITIAFHKALKKDKNRLIIYTTPESYYENPEFTHKLPSLGHRVIVDTKYDFYKVFGELDRDSIIVSGWCADQLFGSYANISYPFFYNDPWKEGAIKTLECRHIDPRPYFDSLEILDDIVKSCMKYPIEQFCEFVWWINFSMKWTYVTHVFQLECPFENIRNNTLAYFDTPYFEDWCIWHYPQIRKNNPILNKSIYKLPMKKYIEDFTHDSDYTKNKGKVSSWNCQYDNGVMKGRFPVLDTEGFKEYPCQEKQDRTRIFIENYRKEGF